MKKVNHNMRTYFTRFIAILLLMLGVAGQMSAAEQTFTMSSQGWNNGIEATTLSGIGFSVSWDKGSNSNAPKYYTTGSAVRAYGGNTITITAKTGYTVSGVTFTFGSGDGSNTITANTGTFTSPNWSGSLAAGSSVVFTISGTSGHRRISTIKVTYENTSSTAYTVTLKNEDLGTLSTLNQSSVGASVTLPSRSNVGAWTFLGWSTTDVGTTETTTRPTTIISAGSYTPTDNVVLYPVYTRSEGDDTPTEALNMSYTSNNWILSSSNNYDKGSYVLLYTNGYVESQTEIDLSELKKVVVQGGTYGGSTYNSFSIYGVVNGTPSLWKNGTFSGTDVTTTITEGNSLSGMGKIRVVSNSGTQSSSGIRMKSVVATTQGEVVTYYIRKPTNLTAPTFYDSSSSVVTSLPDITMLVGDYKDDHKVTVNSGGALTYSCSSTPSGAVTVENTGANKGRVTANAEGTAAVTITAAANGSYTSGTISYGVTVVKPNIATISSITPSTTSMLIGDNGTTTVSATIYNELENASDKYDRTFSSSNPDVLTVDESTGAYTAVGLGSATITVQYAPKSAYANRYKTVTLISVTISVAKPAVAVISGSLVPSSVDVGATGTFSGLTITPYTGLSSSDYTVSYSSNSEKLTVTSEGGYTANTTGSVTVTVTVIPVNTTMYATVSQNYTVTVMAAAADGDYIKVTSEPSDWTGTYLIVYESGSLAMNGGLTTLDASGNSIAVTITDDKIAANSTNDAASFNIASDDEGGWTIKSKSGYYIGWASTTKNGMSTSTNDAYTNLISVSDGEATIEGTGGRTLRYNAATGDGNLRFRYYTTSSQQPIALYKRKVALDGTKTTGTASFGTTSQTLAVGDSWTNTLTTNSNGTPTYSSSNSAIVSVDENTGEITAEAVGGPVTITVTIPETPTHTAASATYTVSVVSAEADGSYVLVESEPADWSGTYLIVNADDATAGSGIALDGSLDASSLSASGNGRSVTIAAKKIPATASTNASSFVVAKSGDVYSLKSASGLFIGRDAASNGMDTSSETAYLNTLSLTSDGVVEIVGEGGKHIAYNSSVATFKYYSMAANVYLYKKTSTSGDELISTTVTFDEPKTLIKKVGDTWTKTATTNSSARPHYSSSDAKIVKVVNATTGEMKALKTGTVTITANVPENEVYTSAEDSYTVTVNKGDNDLALTSSSAVTLGTSTSAYTITYSTSSTGTITWNSSDETIATVAQGSGKTGIVTLTGNVGTVTITFSQGADEDYEASTGSQSVTITVSTSGSNVAYYYRLSGGAVPTGTVGIEYLLVCEDKSKAADSYTLGNLVNTNGVTGKTRNVPTLDVTIVDDRIEASDRLDQAMYLFTGSGSAFQIKSSRNTYIGDTDFQGCSKPAEVANGLSEVGENGYFVGTTEEAPVMYNTVTIEDGNLIIEGGGLAPSVGGTTVHRYLRYNPQSYFFRYYRYDSGVQQKLALYKRATSSDKYVQFVPHSKELEVGETWTTTIFTQNTTGTPTYESMNPAVAIVDPNTGVITAVSSGTADVKVTVDGVENYANVSVKSSGALLSRYIKMTNTSDLVNGDYLVVYESSETEGYLMDGSLTMSNNTPVAKTTTNAIIEDDKDQTNYPGAKCIGATPTIDTGNFIFAMKYSGADVYHTVRSHSGYYIGKQASADGLDVTTGSPFNNVLTAPGSSTSFKGEGTTYLKYNTTDENFQFYTTGQSVIQLYKKIPYNYELYAGSVTPRIQKADVAGPGLLAPNAIAIYNLSSTVAANETLMENIKNEPNVVVNGTTQSFVLSDYKEEGGAKTYYPFYAPLSSAGSDKSFTAAAVSYSRPNAGGWNSVCLPFSIPFEKVTELFGTDSKVYQLTDVNAEHNVEFTELTDEMDPVPAGEPVLVYSKDDTWNATNVAGSFSVKGDVAGRKVVGNAKTTGTAEIIGTYSTLIPGTVDGSTLYKLKADGTSFGTMSATAKVYPFRMYIKYTPPPAQSAPANLPVKIHVIEGTIGDLNKDKMATLSDLTRMINMVNGVEEKTNAADLDGDGDVNGVDVNRLAKILTKSK